jgi:hypothetical protein
VRVLFDFISSEGAHAKHASKEQQAAFYAILTEMRSKLPALINVALENKWLAREEYWPRLSQGDFDKMVEKHATLVV